jgi:hypothetical protein
MEIKRFFSNDQKLPEHPVRSLNFSNHILILRSEPFKGVLDRAEQKIKLNKGSTCRGGSGSMNFDLF